MEDKKDIKIKGMEDTDSGKLSEDDGYFEKEWNFKDEPFDGTSVFKTRQVTKIIDEAIAIIEERWSGWEKLEEEQKKSEATQESDKAEQQENAEESEKEGESEEKTEADEETEVPEKTEIAENTNNTEKTKKIKIRRKTEKNKKCKKNKKTKKRKKNNTQSGNKKLNRAFMAVALLLMVLAVGRIIYVNRNYPSAKIYILNQNQQLTGLKYNIAVNHTVIYSKEQWIEYLKKNISEEENFDADSYSYLPGIGDNYDVICAEISVTNKTDDVVSIFDLRARMVLQSGYKPVGECVFIREKLDNYQLIQNNQVEARQTGKFVCAYILKKEYKDDLLLQYCELGNNQRMILDIKDER